MFHFKLNRVVACVVIGLLTGCDIVGEGAVACNYWRESLSLDVSRHFEHEQVVALCSTGH